MPRENGNILSIGGLDVSTRLVVVMVVAAILSVMLVPSLFQWWQQERELVQIKSQVAEQQKKNADMQRQLDLWNDPDYISTQARERLGYVRPGETQYTVVDPGPQYQDSAMAAAATPTGPARPWVQQVAILVGKADQPPTSNPIPSADTSESGQGNTTGEESEEGASLTPRTPPKRTLRSCATSWAACPEASSVSPRAACAGVPRSSQRLRACPTGLRFPRPTT